MALDHLHARPSNGRMVRRGEKEIAELFQNANSGTEGMGREKGN